MRKVLLIPLLILIPLSGVQALSSSGTTPGASVLHGGLARWSSAEVQECDIHDQNTNAVAILGDPARLASIGETAPQRPSAEVGVLKSEAERVAAQDVCDNE